MSDFSIVILAYHVALILVLYDVGYWRGYMKGKRGHYKHNKK